MYALTGRSGQVVATLLDRVKHGHPDPTPGCPLLAPRRGRRLLGLPGPAYRRSRGPRRRPPRPPRPQLLELLQATLLRRPPRQARSAQDPLGQAFRRTARTRPARTHPPRAHHRHRREALRLWTLRLGPDGRRPRPRLAAGRRTAARPARCHRIPDAHPDLPRLRHRDRRRGSAGGGPRVRAVPPGHAVDAQRRLPPE